MAAAPSRTSPPSSARDTKRMCWRMSRRISSSSPSATWWIMADRPTTLLVELTHRCPLHCPYCSNPLELVRSERELATEDWTRVLSEARALGVLQLGLSGGEPLVRRDLEAIVSHAHGLGLYTTLVTSAIGLTEARTMALRDAGLEHIQISLQDAGADGNDRIAGTASW